MAPNRRSTARGASATPARGESPSKRSTGSNVGTTDVAFRRPTRVQGPSDTVVDNPQLPEIQTQQSFAYGAKEIPLLPEQLVARGKMTLQQMAETIDIGIAEANQNFEEQALAAANYGRLNQAAARDIRARRRSESRDSSVQSSREGSIESVDSAIRTSMRTATWASDMANSTHLQDIAEESFQGGRDDPMDVDGKQPNHNLEGPSTFPTGNFDTSYSVERRNRMRPATDPEGFVMITKDLLRRSKRAIINLPRQAYNLPRRVYNTVPTRSMNRTHLRHSPFMKALGTFMSFLLGTALVTLGVLLFVAGFTTLLCNIFSPISYDPDSLSPALNTIRSFCANCPRPLSSADKLVLDNGTDFAAIAKVLGRYDQRLRDFESRIDSDRSTLSATLDQVIEKQRGVEVTVSDLQQRHQDSPAQSPLMQKINYCSPGTGAVIDPYLTSPTKQKKFSSWQRIVIGSTGLQKYQSRPPAEALRSWEDVGDCWCSAPANGYAQLGVLLGHAVYPTEIVIEHLPTLASPSPNTAPKNVEIWADISHLDAENLMHWGFDKLPQEVVSGTSFSRIGSAKYEAAAGLNHVQTFKLDVNQELKNFPTQKVIFRAKSNYGGEHTCFYRVRVHGMPIVAHPEVVINGGRSV